MDFNHENLPPAVPFVVGLVGGIVSLRGAPGASWKERFFHVVSAGALAGFCSPALTEWFGLTTPAMQSCAAFVVGLFGLNLTATAVEWIRGAKLADFMPWAKKGD